MASSVLRIMCNIITVPGGKIYAMKSECAIRQGFYRTRNMDRLNVTSPCLIAVFHNDSHQELILREAACLQSCVELIEIRCGCIGFIDTLGCMSFKAKVNCTVHYDGREGGTHCTNSGASQAPSGTFNFAWNTEPDQRQN